MKLKDLLSDCACGDALGREAQEQEITGVVYDSRKAVPGSLFVAVQGEHADGHRFIEDALSRGAVAAAGELPCREGLPAALYLRVDDSRAALACLSNVFFGRPSREVAIIGVTGTNGKTTTTYLIKAILEAWGKTVGLIGTVNYLIGDRVLPAPHTTPEAPEFQGLLRQMCSDGCSFVATEVSSHALAQRRVDATQFAVAVFTNLTRDHLDYHGTFDAYYAAKQRLFTELLNVTGTAVVNVDDVWGRRLLSEIDRPVLTYGLESDADLTACNVTHRFSGMRFSLHRKGGEPVMIESGLIGLVNVSNILAAVGACISVGVPMDCIHEGIRKALPVPGRLQKIDEGQDFLCIVDYAHTPDALERLLTEAGRLAAVTGGRIITVFGCGGNRDRGKRPVMGEISARLSDVVFVTSDNPREEDPSAIIAGIESGLRGKALCSSLPDRAEAIDRAIGVARSGDVVVIAGKGHEDYQEIGDRRLRFDDRVKAAEAIRLKMKQERGSP